MKETGTKYRGLAPHKITPMLGVLHVRTGVAFIGLLASLSPVPRDFYRYPNHVRMINDSRSFVWFAGNDSVGQSARESRK